MAGSRQGCRVQAAWARLQAGGGPIQQPPVPETGGIDLDHTTHPLPDQTNEIGRVDYWCDAPKFASNTQTIRQNRAEQNRTEQNRTKQNRQIDKEEEQQAKRQVNTGPSTATKLDDAQLKPESVTPRLPKSESPVQNNRQGFELLPTVTQQSSRLLQVLQNVPAPHIPTLVRQIAGGNCQSLGVQSNVNLE